MPKHFDKHYKLDAVQYYQGHKDLGMVGCAANLGISQQTVFGISMNQLYILYVICFGLALITAIYFY
jgi:transposase